MLRSDSVSKRLSANASPTLTKANHHQQMRTRCENARGRQVCDLLHAHFFCTLFRSKGLVRGLEGFSQGFFDCGRCTLVFRGRRSWRCRSLRAEAPSCNTTVTKPMKKIEKRRSDVYTLSYALQALSKSSNLARVIAKYM